MPIPNTPGGGLKLVSKIFARGVDNESVHDTFSPQMNAVSFAKPDFLAHAAARCGLTVAQAVEQYRDVAFALTFEHNEADIMIIGFVRHAIYARHTFCPSMELTNEVLEQEGIRLPALARFQKQAA